MGAETMQKPIEQVNGQGGHAETVRICRGEFRGRRPAPPGPTRIFVLYVQCYFSYFTPEIFHELPSLRELGPS